MRMNKLKSTGPQVYSIQVISLPFHVKRTQGMLRLRMTLLVTSLLNLIPRTTWRVLEMRKIRVMPTMNNTEYSTVRKRQS
jgi:hypothetical protein